MWFRSAEIAKIEYTRHAGDTGGANEYLQSVGKNFTSLFDASDIFRRTDLFDPII